jgi:peptide/nickel transport system permease protein
LKRYLIKRLIISVPLVLIIMILNFTIIHLAPGDPVAFMISGVEFLTPAVYEAQRAKLGLDKPLYVQLYIYLSNLIRGDWGFSYTYRRPVIDIIMSRVPNTLLLTISSYIVSAFLGVATGVIASKKPYGRIDNIISTFSLVTWSMPYFWMGLIFLLVFGLYTGWFPIHGMYEVGLTGMEKTINILWHLVLPASCLALGRFANLTRLSRASMLEEIRKDYIITAWGKGLDERVVYYKHAFRNALLPIVTVLALKLRDLFSGSLLIETIFGWPGIGTLTYDSILSRDYNMLIGVFLIISIITILANLIADISYAYLDPRIRYR